MLSKYAFERHFVTHSDRALAGNQIRNSRLRDLKLGGEFGLIHAENFEGFRESFSEFFLCRRLFLDHLLPANS